MNDNDISSLLKALPRQKASADFTGLVMNRAGSPDVRRFDLRKLAAAAGLILLLAAGGAWSRVADMHRQDERLRAMQTEKDEIRREIDELKRLTQGYDGVIEIPVDGVDFVIQLNEETETRLAKQSLPPV